MIIVYYQVDSTIQSANISAENTDLLQNALWIDMLSPTREDEKIIETFLNIDIPTKMEREEIEPSSRLYIEENVLFMTTTVVALADFPIPKNDVVTFIMTDKKLITIRYIELHAFNLFTAKLSRIKRKQFSAAYIFFGLIDSIVERLADILEKISHQFDEISLSIFHATEKPDHTQILQKIGTNGDLVAKARESIVSFTRLISFLEEVDSQKISIKMKSHLIIIDKDIRALSDFAGFISTKVNFLLDATLGMINIEQNNIIKIFSVAAVIFLPPTLIASLYGMNFHFMPELNWYFGYPFAILLMLISAFLPYTYFKKKKWL